MGPFKVHSSEIVLKINENYFEKIYSNQNKAWKYILL